MSDLYIGIMSGTSLDGIDAALVDFQSAPSRLLSHVFIPMPEALRDLLIDVCGERNVTFNTLAHVDVEIARLVANAVKQLLAKAKIDATQVTAIGSHGQTVFHCPSDSHPTSIQLGDPNLIVELTGITTVADFRRRDIAALGQGAPLVPAFHQAVFHSTEENRIVLNIGGIANITALPKSPEEKVIGFDTGPGNVLMDYWINRHRANERYDAKGAWAASGSLHLGLLTNMLADDYFSSPPPKSTGREKFNPTWLNQHLSALGGAIAAQDVQATLCELTAQSIANAIDTWAANAEKIIVCGGGTHNCHLMERLQTLSRRPIESSADHGIHPDWVEAIAFAWFAKQCIERKPGNLPAVTGAKRPVILGGIYQS